MPESRKKSLSRSDQYRIEVQGIINDSWGDWFGGLNISTVMDAQGVPITNLEGAFCDQAVLRGVLVKLWDLNATLIGVQRINPIIEDPSNHTEV